MILWPPLLGHVLEANKEAWLQVIGSDIIGSMRKLHMANFHMEIKGENTLVHLIFSPDLQKLWGQGMDICWNCKFSCDKYWMLIR